jgi:hypothetical protein
MRSTFPGKEIMAANSSAGLGQLETQLEEYLVKKAPALPPNIKEMIVQWGPWITLVLLILSLPALLALFGLGAMLAPFSFMGGARAGAGYMLSLLTLAVQLVLEGMAIPGLMKRQMSAWRLMFYATLVGAVSSLLSGSIVGMLVGTLVSLYFLFQVKSYYK